MSGSSRERARTATSTSRTENLWKVCSDSVNAMILPGAALSCAHTLNAGLIRPDTPTCLSTVARSFIHRLVRGAIELTTWREAGFSGRCHDRIMLRGLLVRRYSQP